MTFKITTRRFLRGLVKSWSAHFGVWLAMLGYMQTQDKILTKWVGEELVGVVISLIGLAVVALRAKTNESLESKGR